MPPELKVGAAKMSITPPLDQTRRGPHGLATDVIGEFCARALVWDDGSRKAGLVLLDLCDPYDDVTRGIRRFVGEYTDIPPGNILVCSTHTHAAPETRITRTTGRTSRETRGTTPGGIP